MGQLVGDGMFGDGWIIIIMLRITVNNILANCLAIRSRMAYRNMYSVYAQKNSYKADHIFKDYYSRRLTLSPPELFSFFTSIVQHPFTEQDHRWISLAQNLQKYVDKFKVEQQVFMFKTLVDQQSRTQLYEQLKMMLLRRVNELTFGQAAIVLWGVCRNYKPEQLAHLSLLYTRLNDILHPEQEKQQPKIVIGKKNKTQGENEQQKIINISASSISMVLSSMARVGISDKKLLKRLIQDGIRANLNNFTTTSLCTFLLAFQKLGLLNKRDTFQVYKAIRTNYKQLQTASIQTLLNLAVSVSNLSQRDLSQQQKRRIQLHADEIEKQKAQLDDMRVFFGWICETILLRQPELALYKAALILHYARKIQYYHKSVWQGASRRITDNLFDAKIVDLVMCLKAIAALNKQNRAVLQNEQDIIANRLWQLYSSLSGKSLYTLAMLYKMKKIRPPMKIGKMLQQHLIDLETANIKRESSKDTKQNQPMGDTAGYSQARGNK